MSDDVSNQDVKQPDVRQQASVNPAHATTETANKTFFIFEADKGFNTGSTYSAKDEREAAEKFANNNLTRQGILELVIIPTRQITLMEINRVEKTTYETDYQISKVLD
jgi:hypothetical protein